MPPKTSASTSRRATPRASVKSTRSPKRRPVGRPPGKTRDARLKKILAVARRHFAQKGFEETTFEGVSRDAGMTRTALYSYFTSKADLYLATLKDIHEEFLPDFRRALEECATLRERFRRLVMASTAAHARDSSITGFLSALPLDIRRHPELGAAVHDYNREAYGMMTAMFEEAKRSGEISSAASAADLVSAFFGGALGVGLFQYGMEAYSPQAPSLAKAMSVFASMSEGKIFTPRRTP